NTRAFPLSVFDRVEKIDLEMPPLTERGEEFEDIALAMVTEYARELHKEFIRGFHYLAMAQLKKYDWPGNLRELRNVICLAVISAQSSQIEIKDLPQFNHDRKELRAGRVDFEKIYIQELLRVYQGRIEQICQATRTPRDRFLNKA